MQYFIDMHNDQEKILWIVIGGILPNFQANICHAYQILKNNGIPEERIVVMIYDDIVNHDK